MDVLEINLTTAKQLYPNAEASFKNMLESKFGKDALLSPKITDLINGWDDILRLSKRDAKEFELREGETDDELAYRQVKLIAEVYNQGVVLDAGNTGQNKYYPWHEIVKDSAKPSGFGLSDIQLRCPGHVFGCRRAALLRYGAKSDRCRTEIHNHL